LWAHLVSYLMGTKGGKGGSWS